MHYQAIIQQVFTSVNNEPDPGKVVTYIPQLATVNPDKFGVHISTVDQGTFGIGDFEEKFSIQSCAKVFALSLAYKLLGESIWKRLGVEPAGTPFNSLVQLEADAGIPRNPFINSGAIVICDILLSELNDPKSDFLAFLRMLSDLPDLNFSQNIAESEKSVGFRNVALCHFIKSFGNIQNDPDEVLDFYFNLCSIEMSCRQLSNSLLYLANGGQKLSDQKQILNRSQTKRVNAILLTCGFYDESGEFAFKVGLPGKSGVGGGIIAIHPNAYCIALWSPRLNPKGNSYKGMKFLEAFTTGTAYSIF
jgi:glutaminase